MKTAYELYTEQERNKTIQAVVQTLLKRVFEYKNKMGSTFLLK
jgi:hypothetical protein